MNSTLIPHLIDELALRCLARVPRQYHATLSAVSKPIRSAVSSKEFFDIRSELGVADEFLYFRVRAPFQTSAAWSALYRTEQGSLLQAPLPPHPVAGLKFSSAAAFGNSIYVFGGWTVDPATHRPTYSCAVWVLDCRWNVWSPGPSMGAPCCASFAVVLGGRIYLIGGGVTVGGGDPFGVALDVSSGQWEDVPEPPVDISLFRLRAVAADGGVLRVWGSLYEIRFDPATREWTEAIPLRGILKFAKSLCLSKGELYACCQGSVIKRLDEASLEFKEVEGVAQGLPHPWWLGPKLVTAGGHKLVAMVGRGAGRDLDSFSDPPHPVENPSLWRSLTSSPFEAWVAEIKVSKEGHGAVVWSKKVLSLNWPDSPLPRTPRPFEYFPDWNLWQVSV